MSGTTKIEWVTDGEDWFFKASKHLVGHISHPSPGRWNAKVVCHRPSSAEYIGQYKRLGWAKRAVENIIGVMPCQQQL